MTAMELGHDYLVLTDHSPRLQVANGLSVGAPEPPARRGGGGQRPPRRRLHPAQGHRGRHPRRRRPRPDRRAAGAASTCGSPASTPSCGWTPTPMTRRMLAAVAQPVHQRARALHRPPGRRATGGPARRASSTPARSSRRAVEHDVAVEINSRARAARPAHPAARARPRPGCLFSIDSDAHAPGQLDMLDYGCERAQEAGIDPDRIVNTWGRDRLLAWADPSGR